MIVGGEPEAEGRAETHWIADPGTAANDTVVAIALCCPGRSVLGCALVVAVQTILDPLPDVAVHIVETELVGRKRADRCRLPAVPLAAAAVAVGIIFADFVAPGIGCRCARARRVLPFGFGEQAVGPARHFGEPGHILLDLIPVYIDHGLRPPSHIAVRHLRAGANRDAGIPLFERDLELRNCKRPDERGPVTRVFIVVMVAFIGWGSHTT